MTPAAKKPRMSPAELQALIQAPAPQPPVLMSRPEQAGPAEVASPVVPPPAAEKPHPAKRMPWDDIHPDLITQYPLRMPKRLHAKLTYIVDHTPRTSIQKLMLEAVEALVERKLRGIDKD